MRGQAQEDAYDQTETEIETIRQEIEALRGEQRPNHSNFDDVLEDDIINFTPTDEDPPTEFISKANVIFTVITNIGMVVSVLIIAILGLKYMLGSVEEKADYKKDMIPYFVGAGLLFGVTTIVKILQQWGQIINNI